ncbi:MAG TPA: hypothetical protein VGP24_11150 [Glaciihabitans sp.]|nr:hypothetical protein [Glaciihabitans sp.]
MTLGTILAGSFQVMRRNPRPTFGISLVLNGIVAVVSLLAVGAVYFLSFDRLGSATSEDFDTILAGSTGVTVLSAVVTAALSLIASAILQGIISLEVARATVGEKLRLSQLWASARGRVGALIGWSLLAGFAVFVVVFVVITLIVLLVVGLGDAGILAAVLLGLVSIFGGIVLAAWFATRLALVPSVLLIERAKLFPAIRRSWKLSVGYFWRTFGILLLVWVIVTTAAQIVLVPVSFVMGIISALTNPNADPTVIDDTFFITLAVTTVFSALVGAVTAIITSASASLIYIDLRMRKEGLDLALTRFVEARQMGDTSVADPYLVTTTTAPTTPTTPTQPGPPQSGSPQSGTESGSSGDTSGTDRSPRDSPWA